MNNGNRNKIIVGIVLFIVIIIFILLIRGCSSDTAELLLIGQERITIYQNDQYIEPGYKIVDTTDTNGYYINIDGVVNTNQVGNYVLKYMLYKKNGKLVSEKTREVIVLEDDLSNINMYLKGDSVEYFFVNDYVDHGVEVYNRNVDITNEVIVDSNVRADTVGEYEVKYQIKNNSYTKEIIRKVKIVDYNITEDIDVSNLLIGLVINCDDYYYTVLPDGTKLYSKYIDYKFEKEGEYTFDIHLKNDSHKEYIVNIQSIDKDGPVGTCTLNYGNNKTTIIMNVSDKSGISKYSYNGLEFTEKNKIINSIAMDVTVRAYDKHNNYTDIKCKAELSDGYRDVPIDANGTIQNKSGFFVCGTNTTKENQELANLMKAYGYKTRGAVAMAATYLANYKYKISYFWGGKPGDIGFHKDWGCRKSHKTDHNCTHPLASDKSVCEYGLDCAGLVKWSYIQAGFDKSTVRGEDTTTHKWGNFNPKPHVYRFSSNRAYADQIKPGDIVHKPGHVGIVIGVDKDTVQVAEMVMYGIDISILKKDTGQSTTHRNDFPEFLLMDEYFKMYGN